MAAYDWNTIRQNIFAGESGGDYNALFGYSNRPGKQFEGTRLTDMTVDQALAFADPSGPYGQWVKGQVGRVATPMGAYQVVGTTLRDAKRGLGLRGDEKMTPELQDRIGRWIYEAQGTGAWEGYKPDAGARSVAADTMQALGKGKAMAQMTPISPAAPQQEKRGLLGNQELLDALAVGLSGLSMNPNEGIVRLAQARMANRMEERKTAKETNKTVEMLKRIGADPRLIELAQSGYAKEAIGLAYAKPKQPQVMEVDGRLIQYDPTTGQTKVIYGQQTADALSKDQMTALNSLRDDLRTELKPFEIVKSGYNNITTFYEKPGSTSDYALAVAFAKILDPGSVAREGEVAAVQNAGAKIPALGQALKNAITGEGSLSPAVREEIARLATEIYRERAQEANQIISGYGELARRGNVPAELLYSGSIPEVREILPAVVPPAAAQQGVTQEMWDKATVEEKQSWM